MFILLNNLTKKLLPLSKFYCVGKFGIADMKYYKEMALQLKVSVPILNDDLKYDKDKKCLVQGIQKIVNSQEVSEKNQILIQQVQSEQSSGSIQQSPEQQKQKEIQDVYILSQNNFEQISFQEALQLSKHHSLDLQLVKPLETPLLRFTRVREGIYRKYYEKNFISKAKSKNRVIKINPRITQNDLKQKKNIVERLKDEGSRNFKFVAKDDSELSQKVLKDLGNLLGFKKMKIKLDEYDKKKKSGEAIERWTASLKFSEERQIDIDYINKKWKRRQFEKAKPQKKLTKKQIEDKYSEDGTPNFQIYQQLFKNNVEVPHYQEDFQFSSRKFKSNQDSQKAMIERIIKNNPQMLSQTEKGGQLPPLDQQTKSYYAKLIRQYSDQKTLDDILDEIEDLETKDYLQSPYLQAKYKSLQAELQELVQDSQEDSI